MTGVSFYVCVVASDKPRAGRDCTAQPQQRKEAISSHRDEEMTSSNDQRGAEPENSTAFITDLFSRIDAVDSTAVIDDEQLTVGILTE